MRTRALWLLIAAIAVCVPVPLVAFPADATHVTTLALASYDFDDGSGPQPAVVADLTSTDPDDWSWHVTWFVQPPGGAEGLYGTSEVAKDNPAEPPSGVGGAIAMSGLSPGATVRALYHAKDRIGTVRLSISRTVVVP